jgi:hypothetical protein
MLEDVAGKANEWIIFKDLSDFKNICQYNEYVHLILAFVFEPSVWLPIVSNSDTIITAEPTQPGDT